MAFTVGSTAAKDSGGTAIPGGLLSADIAGGGVGPTFLFHSLVDGVAGSNKVQVTAANALKVDASGVAVPITDNSGSLTVDGSVTAISGTAANLKVEATLAAAQTLATVTTLTGITNVVHVDDNSSSLTVDYATTGSGTATGAIRVELPTNGTGVIATVGAVTSITNALPAGTNAIGKLAANSAVDIGDVDVTSIVPGTGATNLGKGEDLTHSSGDVGVMALAVRKDTSSTGIGSDGDYVPLAVNSTGHTYVHVDETQLGSLGQSVAATSVPVVHASDRQNSIAFPIVMTADTGVLASGDLIADTQQLDAFFNKSDGKGVINSITIIERDAQGAAYNIFFHRTSTSMGTENSTPTISDANAAAGIQGMVAVATTDFVTVSGTKVACIKNIGLPVTAVSGTDDIYVSIVNSTGTPTYAGGTIDMVIGALLD